MKLNNFRQFKGKNTINFTPDKNKNVTIILGDNGAGKTTLLQAFNWCLYDVIKLDHPNEIINKDTTITDNKDKNGYCDTDGSENIEEQKGYFLFIYLYIFFKKLSKLANLI